MSTGREHDERINGVLRKRAYVNGAPERVEHETPLSILLAGERGALDDADYQEQRDVRGECFADFMGWIFAAGPHPAVVVRRVFCIAKAVRPELIANMDFRDLGIIFNESHEASRKRLAKMICEPVEAAGGTFHVPSMRGESTRQANAAAARRTRNRSKQPGAAPQKKSRNKKRRTQR